MEKFRKNFRAGFGPDPTNFHSLPGCAWEAALKMTKTELELFPTADKYSFFENSIRGGISQISKRYVKANNKYLHDYDETKDNTFLLYVDANNLYGHSMMGKLPVKNFEWITVSKKVFVTNILSDFLLFEIIPLQKYI